MSPQPRICVVLPVDQPAAPALESLAAQDLARDRFQVVAVAPASAREAVQARLAGSGLAHQLVEAPEGADPRNAGLDEAAADHVMLLDAQDRITPNALSALDAAADSYRLPLLVTDEEAEELEQRPANELALYKLPRLAARVRGKLYPSDMLSGHRFQDTSAGSEAVLSARIHERFATQYVQVDLAATRAGARIVPACSASTTTTRACGSA